MKKIFKRLTPDIKKLQNHKYLSWLGKYILEPRLWFFNRRTIANGFAVGLFCAFLPMPFQMPVAAVAAIVFRANIAISVALVWITNPITMPAIFYFAYKIGALVLGVEIIANFSFSFSYLGEVISVIWQPFLLGCFILSSVTSVLGYFTIKIIYRINIYRHIKRKQRVYSKTNSN